jgi:hypothetical protein
MIAQIPGRVARRIVLDGPVEIRIFPTLKLLLKKTVYVLEFP